MSAENYSHRRWRTSYLQLSYLLLPGDTVVQSFQKVTLEQIILKQLVEPWLRSCTSRSNKYKESSGNVTVCCAKLIGRSFERGTLS